VRQAFIDGTTAFGCGASASRLVSGNTSAHEELEARTRDYTGKEAAVLFASGYQANVGALSSLLTEGDAIFSDELVHASLIDGARLSKAAVHIYRHADMSHLELLLKEHDDFGVRMIVTDSIFSMDGDEAPLTEIVDLATKYDAAIYLDEAHAVGVIGPNGSGLAAALGLRDRIDVLVGTYSKAFGVSGGFVATDRAPAAVLRSRARSLLFSTGQPPAIAAAIIKSLELAVGGDALRARLSTNIETFRQSALERSLPLKDTHTAIQPVMTFSNSRTMAVSLHLWNQGFFVQGIRPPTVKEGAARLRVTLSALHETGDIVRLTEAIRRALNEVPV
jgi:8-amino-7-oxononanoate synthase